MKPVKSLVREASRPQKKALIGVSHGSKQELIALLRELDKRKPASVGLELREDYETAGYRVGFFGDLYEYLKPKVSKILLLDNPKLWNEMKTVEILKAVHEGILSLAQLEYKLAEVMRRVEDGFADPEELAPLIPQVERAERALDLNRELPTKDMVLQRWQELNAQRSDYFVRRILQDVPELVVVGVGHARQMASKLEEQYTLEIFSEAPAELKGRTILSHDLFNQ